DPQRNPPPRPPRREHRGRLQDARAAGKKGTRRLVDRRTDARARRTPQEALSNPAGRAPRAQLRAGVAAADGLRSASRPRSAPRQMNDAAIFMVRSALEETTEWS